MKKRMLIRTGSLALCVAAGLAMGSQAQTVLSTGHTDVGLAYELGEWDLHIHQHVPDTEFAPNEAILRLNASSARPIPSSPSFSFLGTAGMTYYVLPQVEENDLLFLGLAAEEIPDGEFVGNTMKMTLKSVAGPGNFSLYFVDGFGEPTVFMNSGDGIAATDSVDVPAGGHTDYNWAFTAPGTYTVGFEATGNHITDGATASGTVLYTFEVVPEPGTWGLIVTGATLAFALGRRKR